MAGADLASSAGVDEATVVVMGLVLAVVVVDSAGVDSVGAAMADEAKQRERVMAKVI